MIDVLLNKEKFYQHEIEEGSIASTIVVNFIILLLSTMLINIVVTNLLDMFFILPDKNQSRLENKTLLNFTIVSLIGPCVEEIIFRLNLRSTKINLSIGLAAVSWFIANFLLDNYLIVSLVALTILLTSYKFLNSGIVTFLNKNRFEVYHVSCLVFGFLHVTNYTINDITDLLMAMCLVSPQLFIGYYLAYIRIVKKDGFIICVLIHILINSTGFYFIR